MDFNPLLRDRTQPFSIAAIRPSTSVAAHYRAACRARSEKEKLARICIAIEELEYLNSEKIICLKKEYDELNW